MQKKSWEKNCKKVGKFSYPGNSCTGGRATLNTDKLYEGKFKGVYASPKRDKLKINKNVKYILIIKLFLNLL